MHAINRLECKKLSNPIAGVTEESIPSEEPYETEEPVIIPEETDPPPVVIPSTSAPITSEEIPFGTYVGTIEFSDRFLTFAASITSEVIITIGIDGKVTGSFDGQIIDTPYTYENCPVQWESVFSGEFSGTLTGPEGVIQSSETMDFDPNTNCVSTFTRNIDSFDRSVSIQISGDTLTGITDLRPDNPDEIFILTFKAIKQ